MPAMTHAGSCKLQARPSSLSRRVSKRAHRCQATAAPPAPQLGQNGRQTTETVRIAVLGASGYTGEEVVRLLTLHPTFKITALTGESQAGKAFSEVYPHLGRATDVPNLIKIGDVDFAKVDAVFCCLPHGTTQATLASLPKHVRIVDLSADFRLKDPAVYGEWYGEHQAVELQKEAVYGLPEIYRDEIRNARLVANPGCYPTSVQLPLIPLLQQGLISPDNIVINSMSGVSGAGRSAKQNLLYTEITESVNAYGITRHRHVPEIEQGLGEAFGRDVRVSFTPNLMPMSRGMQSTCYVTLSKGQTADTLRTALEEYYADEFFVHVLKKGEVPRTGYVRGTNFNCINVFEDRLPGRAIVISVIDNLVKGASGQAIQNLNLMMGIPETTALQQLALAQKNGMHVAHSTAKARILSRRTILY